MEGLVKNHETCKGHLDVGWNRRFSGSLEGGRGHRGRGLSTARRSLGDERFRPGAMDKFEGSICPELFAYDLDPDGCLVQQRSELTRNPKKSRQRYG